MQKISLEIPARCNPIALENLLSFGETPPLTGDLRTDFWLSLLNIIFEMAAETESKPPFIIANISGINIRLLSSSKKITFSLTDEDNNRLFISIDNYFLEIENPKNIIEVEYDDENTAKMLATIIKLSL